MPRSRKKTVTETARACRLQLSLPKSLMDEIQQRSQEEQTTLLETIKRLIRCGLFVFKTLKDPNKRLFVREEGREVELIIP
jgi:hypothetical protein